MNRGNFKPDWKEIRNIQEELDQTWKSPDQESKRSVKQTTIWEAADEPPSTLESQHVPRPNWQEIRRIQEDLDQAWKSPDQEAKRSVKQTSVWEAADETPRPSTHKL